jgi:type VII secretion-associated protein (TIGR03931 family)
VSGVVVVVGPKEVVGRGAVDPEMATIALECLDDDLALVDDRVVSVDDLWRDVLETAVGGACAELLVICPSWWASSRIARVSAAAGACASDVVVLRRAEISTSDSTVIELAPELVVVHADGQRHSIARTRAAGSVVDAVVACVDGLATVTVDVPAGVALLGADLVRALRHRRIDATVVDDRALVDAAGGSRDETSCETATVGHRIPPRAAAVAVAILTVGAITAAAMALDQSSEESVDAAWLVEGRVAVEVPAQWTVERITSGPGSARVQVVSPTNGTDAIHVTQSRVPATQTLDSAAEALEAALADQPDGVFVDFDGRGERADRAAVTYREVRADRRIDWTVLLDGGVRIAIGCQGSGERPGPERLCDRAIRSAHAVGRK